MRGSCHFLEPDHVQPELHSLPLPQPLNLESFSHVLKETKLVRSLTRRLSQQIDASVS